MTTRFEYPFTSRYATVDGVRLLIRFLNKRIELHVEQPAVAVW